ncbi:MAG: hypothetical protein EZS28_009367, partial [Streblomastix strix]
LGFSGGIIQYARCSFIIVSDLFNHTTFRSYKKSYVHNYKTPAIVISSGIQQLKPPTTVPNVLTGISKKIPQCLLPLTTDSNGDTHTELFVHQSDKEFAAITAYSLEQIDVSHSFVLSLQIAICQNGPQAVEQPIRNLICSSSHNGCNASPAPYCIVCTQSAQGLSPALKFTHALTVAGVVRFVDGNAAKLSYKAKLFLVIVICQLTQHDYTIERVALPLAPSDARVYRCPSLVI